MCNEKSLIVDFISLRIIIIHVIDRSIVTEDAVAYTQGREEEERQCTVKKYIIFIELRSNKVFTRCF